MKANISIELQASNVTMNLKLRCEDLTDSEWGNFSVPSTRLVSPNFFLVWLLLLYVALFHAWELVKCE